MPRYRGWGRRPRAAASAITQSSTVTRKNATCRGCGQPLAAGSSIVLVRLKKRFRLPCTGCGTAPAGQKKFHPGCVPADLNKAMGYNPNAHTHAPAACAPPPKPPEQKDLDLAALAALEAALIARAKRRGVTPEMENDFRKYNGLKARVLQPGTPGEGEVATSIAIQKLVKLVFA